MVAARRLAVGGTCEPSTDAVTSGMDDSSKEIADAIEAAMTMDHFTVSHGFDTYRGGQKQSHFVSANFTPPPSADPQTRRVAVLVASRFVTKLVVHTAVARGSITVDEANDLIAAHAASHDLLIKKAAAGVTSAK